MTLRSSDLQSDSDLDSIRNSSMFIVIFSKNRGWRLVHYAGRQVHWHGVPNSGSLLSSSFWTTHTYSSSSSFFFPLLLYFSFPSFSWTIHCSSLPPPPLPHSCSSSSSENLDHTQSSAGCIACTYCHCRAYNRDHKTIKGQFFFIVF